MRSSEAAEAKMMTVETHSEGQDSDGGKHVQIFQFRLVRVSSSQVICLLATRPKIQELQHVASTQVRS